MKLRITTDIVIENGVSKITNTTIVPISEDVLIQEDVQGKQEPAPQPEQSAPQRTPIPATVGQTPTQGKGNWFAGTTWE